MELVTFVVKIEIFKYYGVKVTNVWWQIRAKNGEYVHVCKSCFEMRLATLHCITKMLT